MKTYLTVAYIFHSDKAFSNCLRRLKEGPTYVPCMNLVKVSGGSSKSQQAFPQDTSTHCRGFSTYASAHCRRWRTQCQTEV